VDDDGDRDRRDPRSLRRRARRRLHPSARVVGGPERLPHLPSGAQWSSSASRKIRSSTRTPIEVCRRNSNSADASTTITPTRVPHGSLQRLVSSASHAFDCGAGPTCHRAWDGPPDARVRPGGSRTVSALSPPPGPSASGAVNPGHCGSEPSSTCDQHARMWPACQRHQRVKAPSGRIALRPPTCEELALPIWW